jgi:hypothetical protein
LAHILILIDFNTELILHQWFINRSPIVIFN